MPKINSKSSRLRNFVSEFKFFTTDGIVLYCTLCDISVNGDRRFLVLQHINTNKHIKNSKDKSLSTINKQQLVSNITKKLPFYEDLCSSLLRANIPLKKINNKAFREFLSKYIKHDIPDESTLRKNYVPEIYNKTIQKIRDYVNNNRIWISIDETTDVEGRYIANVIIGTLEINEPGQIFFLASEILEKANHQGICKLFEDSLLLLWPDKICRENVLLFVTDAAPYMVKAAKVLQSLFTKMIHITCVAHGLHRISEEVRKHFSKVDSLISNGKKVFLKAPSRINAFQTIAPEISLPPQPIITRWGTWLDAAAYYSDHFDTFFRVMQTFDKNDASSVNITKSLMEDPTIKNDLIFIKTHFGFLVDKITSLEKQGVLLTDSILIVEEVKAKIFQVPGNVGKSIQTKLNSVYDKNHGLKKLNTISNILAGKNHVTIQDLEEELTTSDLPCFKYAPVSSTDVERSFSKFKMLLSDNRRKFTFDNLKKTLIIQCNSQLLGIF